jgi:hypothetical protein
MAALRASLAGDGKGAAKARGNASPKTSHRKAG